MSNKARWINLAQLANKAGKCVVGSQLIPAIQSNKVKLVLISDQCGNNTKKKLQDKTTFYDIPLVKVKEEELECVNNRGLAALGISDAGFARAILESLQKVGDDDGLQQTTSKKKTQ